MLLLAGGPDIDVRLIGGGVELELHDSRVQADMRPEIEMGCVSLEVL